MVTAEEIGSVPLFSVLKPEELEHLSRVTADIRLSPGEYAVNDGDERAIFAVLAGTVEAVRVNDGIEQVIGQRHEGDVFGEIPIVLGTAFLAGFRAAGEARVMRIEFRDYHTVAAAEPELAKEVGKMAAYRMGGAHGMQALAAEPLPARAIVAGPRWDHACFDLRQFLERNQIAFNWIPADAPDAEAEWGGPLPGEDQLPVIRIVGGETISRPGLRQVAELLELETEPRDAEYDTVIIGAGPAGLAAAVYGASEGLSTIVVEREAPGGQAGTSSRIENYLGFPSGVSGDELASRALRQARRLGAQILVTRCIERIDAETRELHLDGGDVLRARTIVLACGVTWRQMQIDGFDRLAGRGISYGAARSEAPDAHGLDVHIVGAGNSAGQAAMFFSRHANSVTIVYRGDRLEKSMSQYLIDQIATRPNIDVMLEAQVIAVRGEKTLEAIEVEQADGTAAWIDSGGLFIFIGADAQTGWLPPEIALDQRGFVLTGAEMKAADHWSLERDPFLLETSVPGIFACGDVRFGPVKRVAAAVGEGSMAIAFIHQFLKEAEAA